MVDNSYNAFNTPNQDLLPTQYTSNQIFDNDISKLMYYLYSINIVIEANIEKKYIDYQNSHNISKEDEDIIFNLASKYKPKIFVDNGIFIIDQNLLQDNSSNIFYQLNEERIGRYVNSQIMIEGNIIKVLQVMACNYGWISDFYHEPIENIIRNKVHRKLAPVIIDNNDNNDNRNNRNNMNNRNNRNNINRNNNNNFHMPDWCKCFIYIIIIIIFVVLSMVSNGKIIINY